ncbi:MAG: hypothetical protein CME61_07245 [Halobacteriovoraceae bacterium]|nr:hypothetical protein [Halobacteriovoraceae bacterium]
MRSHYFKMILFFISIFTLNPKANSFYERFDKARVNCFKELKHPKFEKVPNEQKKYYKNSIVQRLLSPIFISYVDGFGSKLQGVIIDDIKMAQVRGLLKSISIDAKKYKIKNKLNDFESICLASCITNNLMKPNPDINPYTSLDLSIYSGEGFCRHFSLTTKKILDYMSVRVRMSYAPEHAFLKFKKNNLDFIFDPSFSNGFHSCKFLSR